MEFLKSYLLAFLGIGILLTIWIAVQSYWRKFFPEESTDEDILARRSDCHYCVSKENCKDPIK